MNVVPTGNKEILYSVHSSDYIKAVEEASLNGKEFYTHGINVPTMRLTKNTYEGALSIVSCTLQAMKYSIETKRHSFAPFGGLHHARYDKAAGFCIFNDLAVAAEYGGREGYRIAVLDLDLHRGEGTSSLLLGKNNIMTVSIHGSGVNSVNSKNNNIDYGLIDETDGSIYLSVLEQALKSIQDFQPNILLVQCGVDAYYADAMMSLSITMKGFQRIYQTIVSFAEENNIPLVCTGGGGYGFKFASPRAWTLLVKEIVEIKTIDTSLPDTWIESARMITREFIQQSNIPESIYQNILEESLSEIPKDIFE